MELEDLKRELEGEFPHYEYRMGKRIYGKCLIVKNTKYSGADIFFKKNKFTIEASIPEMKTRLLLGGGAVYLKLFRKSYSEPSEKIYAYLKESGRNIYLRK